ncbi:hypothetical protein AB0N38_29960 [Micromonospora aurantiaca]|uniref:hypothetical protein n=1 Tax=Micromonospora aurantiaca (nom. illeg.) TaxID=47850 RepID=UPI001E2962AE|nr:hypothetical protein [Micromonospora aurantiaca]UFN92468.1 hypothetical protein LF814_20920 [Micromonospora aurantiaca]
MLLRQIAATAQAVDPAVMAAMGFTLTDVLEVVLAHGHRTVEALGPAWADTGLDPDSVDEVVEPVVAEAEVTVVADLLNSDDADSLPGECSHPKRAAAALAWLTRDARRLTVRHAPQAPALGAVLRVNGDLGSVGVPACLTLSTLAAATEALTGRIASDQAAAARLQALTLAHAAALFSKQIVDRADLAMPSSTRPPVIVGHGHAVTVVSALGHRALSRAINWATAYLHGQGWHELAGQLTDQEAAKLVKVVVYGGPLLVGFHAVDNTVLVHVEELAEILDDVAGDWTTVGCFLEELGRHDGFEEVMFLDILDVWWAWRDHGVLGPLTPAEHPTTLQINPYPRDMTWRRAAQWERTDAILAAAGEPEHVDWPHARLGDDGSADLFTTARGEAAVVNADPPLLVCVNFADAERLGLSPDTLFGFIDGLRMCIARDDDVAEHFRLADGVPILLIMRLIEERTPDDADGYQVRLATDAARAGLSIAIGPDVLEQFAGDGMAGHDLLGLALHEAVKTLRIRRGEAAGVPFGVFRAAWAGVGPVVTLTALRESIPHVTPVDTLPRTPAVRARACRAVFDEVRRRDAPSGRFRDEAAHRVAQTYLVPAIEQELRGRLAGFAPALLWEVAGRLNAAHATRYARNRQLDQALAGQWAHNWHDYAVDDDLNAMASRALELLFEFALAYPTTGESKVDELAVAELAALAELLLVTASLDQGFARDLHGLDVQIDDDGAFAVNASARRTADEPEADDDSLDIDMAAYEQALRRNRIALSRPSTDTDPDGTASQPDGEQAAPQVGVHTRVATDFRSIREALPPTLAIVDDQLKALWGTGFDAVAAVFGTTADWHTGADGLAVVDREKLVGEVVAWSRLPEQEVKAALETLLLTGDALRVAGDRSYLEIEQRAQRVALRPLPLVDGRVWILPWQITAAQQLYGDYLAHARLPYPATSLLGPTVDAMTEHRKEHNTQLEELARDVVVRLGLPHRFRFEQHQMAAAGIRNPLGEIDLLIADASTRRLWVCEIKDPVAAYSPGTLRRHVRKFTRRGGYISKLLAKAEQIAQHVDLAAAACGMPEHGPWRVIPLMITRRVEPAAYTHQPRVAFAMPHTLATVLTTGDDPAPGPTPF